MTTESCNILVVQPDLVGDVVLTSPFLRELKKHFHSSRITVVVHPDTYNLVELCPYLSNVLIYNCKREWFGDNWKYAGQAIKLFFTELCCRHFDLALFPHWDTDNYGASLVCALSGARTRIGFSEHCNSNKEYANRGFDHFFTETILTKKVRHEVEQKLFLLKHFQIESTDTSLELWLSEDDKKFAVDLLSGRDKNKRLIALCMGASLPRKKWPVKNFINVCLQLQKNDCDILIIGSSADVNDAKNLKTNLNSHVLDTTGRTTLRQAAALLKHCDLYVGNDTGPMHLAAAQNLPCIVVSCYSPLSSDIKPLSPTRFGPWQVKSKVLRPHYKEELHTKPFTKEWYASYCDFCTGKYCTCIEKVSVNSVLEAVAEFSPELRF